MNDFTRNLLQHYDEKSRDLPWRQEISPYKVWLSEIMLQQTTVVTVIPYFNTFLEKFPTLQDLAKADLEDILHLWQGLGYYSRARNLHKCAQVVTNEYSGTFPSTEHELIKLPGIGPYTSAAIAAIAFGEPATVVDGNVERVISRIYRIAEPLPKSKNLIRAQAEKLTCTDRPGDYAGAIMDLGATVCKPRKPKCEECPVSQFCKAYKAGDMLEYPKKDPKKAKKQEHGTVYIIKDKQERYYLQKRPDSGLLASLWEFPNTSWVGQSQTFPEPFDFIKEEAEMIGQVRHIFTHIDLMLDVMMYETDELKNGFKLNKLPPLPTLMKKVLKQI